MRKVDTDCGCLVDLHAFEFFEFDVLGKVLLQQAIAIDDVVTLGSNEFQRVDGGFRSQQRDELAKKEDHNDQRV